MVYWTRTEQTVCGGADMKRRIAAILLFLLLLTGCAAESAAPVERGDGAPAAAQTPAPMERVRLRRMARGSLRLHPRAKR